MIIVTGSSGAFGRAAAERLLERVPPETLILTSRTPEKLADLAARGAQIRAADFDDPDSLEHAFAGGMFKTVGVVRALASTPMRSTQR